MTEQLDFFTELMTEVVDLEVPHPMVAALGPEPEEKPTVEFIEPTIESLLPAGFMGAMTDLFKLMEYAEDEIAKAQERHPDHADLIWHTFCIMLPGKYPFQKRAPEVYRSHCRELIERVVNGEDVGLPTMAEMLIGVMHFVTYAAPGHSGACIATYLFRHVMRDDEKAIGTALGYSPSGGIEYDPKEPWQGFSAEQVDKLRHASRLYSDERKKLWQEEKERKNL